jgi:hypothetical protein
MLLFWPAIAAAAPMFSAHTPEHAEIARQAWTAAASCAGWEAPAHEVVRIVQGYVPGGYTGGAYLDDDGLYRIDVGLSSVERALVHEIAHAWATGGSAALTEGRADLLADCIVTRVPGLAPYDPDPGTTLDAMPDLRRWGNPHDDHAATDIDATRRDAYLAASRLARVLATVVDPRELWPQSGTLRWRDLERILEEQGPAGGMVLAVLEGGADRQRDALSDRDRDGQPWLAEVLGGTDPDRWDSDGDGWWDGAPEHSVAAVPLPPDGTPVCAGFSGGPGGGVVQVIAYGQLRGNPAPWISVVAGGATAEGDPRTGVRVPPDEPLMLALSGRFDRATGGAWAMVGGQDLEVDDACRSTPLFTVWVADPEALPVLEGLAGALEEHTRRAEALLGGPPPKRLVVVLGAESAGVSDGVVRLSTGQARWAVESGRPDALAGLAVAVHRVWVSGQPEDRSWDAVEGLTRAIVDDPPDLVFVGLDLGAAEAYGERASACPEGWTGVLAGKCAPR